MSRKRYQTSYDIPIGLPNPQLYTHIQRMQTLLEQYDLQNSFLNKQVLDILNKKQILPTKYQSIKLKNKKPQYKIKRFTQINQIEFDDSPANILETIKKQRLQIQQQKKEIERQRSIQIQRRKAKSAMKFQYCDESQDKKYVSSTAYKRNSFYNSNSRKFSYVVEQQQKYKNTKVITKEPSTNNKFSTKSFVSNSQKNQNLNSLYTSNKIYNQNKQDSQQKDVTQNKNIILTRSISKSKHVLQKINQIQQEDKIKQTQRQQQIINLQASNNIVHVLNRQVYFKSPDQSKVSSPEKRDQSPINKSYENISRISIKQDKSKSKLKSSRSGISVTYKKSPQKKQAKNEQKQSPKQIQKYNIQQFTQTPIRSIDKIQTQDIKISESVIKIQHKQQQKQQNVNVNVQQNIKQNISIQMTDIPIQPININQRIPERSNMAGRNPIPNQNPPAVFQSLRIKYLTSIGINTEPEMQAPKPLITRNKSISYHQINPSQKIIINKAAIEHKQKIIQRTKSVDKKKKFINIVSSDFVSNKFYKNRQNK